MTTPPRTVTEARDALADALVRTEDPLSFKGYDDWADRFLAALPDGWTLARSDLAARVEALEGALRKLMDYHDKQECIDTYNCLYADTRALLSEPTPAPEGTVTIRCGNVLGWYPCCEHEVDALSSHCWACTPPSEPTPEAVVEPYDEADDMCPNCQTPWKCNGPHFAEFTANALRAIEQEAAARALDEVLSVENVARALDAVNAANVRIIDSRDYATALLAALRGDR